MGVRVGAATALGFSRGAGTGSHCPSLSQSSAAVQRLRETPNEKESFTCTACSKGSFSCSCECGGKLLCFLSLMRIWLCGF